MSARDNVIAIKRIAEGMVLVTSFDFGDLYVDQLWSSGKARKHSTCILSDKPIKPGDMAYRPVGNAANRSRRMLASEVDRLELPQEAGA
jgi:hypothetical protein